MSDGVNISGIYLVNESDGLKVKVKIDGRWVTVIKETKTYNIDGSPSLIGHDVSSSGIRAAAIGHLPVGPLPGGE